MILSKDLESIFSNEEVTAQFNKVKRLYPKRRDTEGANLRYKNELKILKCMIEQNKIRNEYPLAVSKG